MHFIFGGGLGSDVGKFGTFFCLAICWIVDARMWLNTMCQWWSSFCGGAGARLCFNGMGMALLFGCSVRFLGGAPGVFLRLGVFVFLCFGLVVALVC